MYAYIIQRYFLDAKKWPATFDRFYRKATLEREVPHGLRSKTDAFRLFINVLLLGRLSKFRSHPDIFSHAPGESILSRRSFVTPRSTVTILRNQCSLSLSLSLCVCLSTKKKEKKIQNQWKELEEKTGKERTNMKNLCSILIQFPLASARRKINYQSFDEKRSTVWKRFAVEEKERKRRKWVKRRMTRMTNFLVVSTKFLLVAMITSNRFHRRRWKFSD